MGCPAPDFARLFHQSSLMRLIVERREDGFYVVDVNKAALNFFHVNLEDVKCHSIASFLDVANTDHIIQAMTVCHESRVPISIQVLPRIPGRIQVQSFLLQPVTSDEGDVLWIEMQAAPPATDNSAIERERDDAISMFTTVFDLSEVGITVTDHHGRFVRLNNAFIRQTGWQTIDLIGEKLTKIIPPEEHEIAWKRHESAIREKRKDFGEIRILRKDGSDMIVMVTSVMLELSNGRSFRISTCVDITELKKAKDDADAANTAKSAFLANMSHELRTPLNAIIGFSEMMINGTLGPIENEHYADYLNDIKFSAQHLLQIINDVLDMSKIEAGKMPLDEEKLDVAGLTDSVVRLMSARAIQEKVTLTQNVQGGLPRLLADERLVRQVFLNLLSNAIKFSESGGMVDVEANLDDSGDLIVYVRDCGIGIPENRMSEIMEPFGQIVDPRLNKGQGTGLGLPIAKAMMEMHGGTLSIESAIGAGTRVTCRFPASRLVAQ